MDSWEAKMIELVRRGHRDRVHFIENMRKSVMPRQVKRIQQNDKSVLKEIVLPKWLDWDLLYEWAMRFEVIDNPRECVLCNEPAELGVDYNQKFICARCFFKLQKM